MRRRPVVMMMYVALFAGGASRAAAQIPLPPSINKPIDAARKAAGATSAQTQQVNKLGASIDAKGQRPAEAAAAAAKAAPPAAEARAQQQSREDALLEDLIHDDFDPENPDDAYESGDDKPE